MAKAEGDDHAQNCLGHDAPDLGRAGDSVGDVG